MTSSTLDPIWIEPAKFGDGGGIGAANQALTAVRQLVGAAAIDLLSYTDGSGEIVAMDGGYTDVAEHARAAITAIARGADAFLLSQAGPRWIETPLGQALLVKVVQQESTTLFLIARPADYSTAARALLMRDLPKIIPLVALHCCSLAKIHELEELRDAHGHALDQGDCAVIAVRADHTIVFANATASEHLANGIGLRLRRGVLRPADHASAIRFEAALDGIIERHLTCRAHRARANIMLLPAIQGGAPPVLIVIAPAGRMSVPRRETHGAAAMIYMLPSTTAEARGMETLCNLHGLSRVESRLTAHLMSGRTLNETAADMHIKVDTARAYLKQIFAKTGMHRQTDLLSLMTRYQRALHGDFDFQPA